MINIVWRDSLHIIKLFFRRKERYIKSFIEAFIGYVALHISMSSFSSKTAFEALLLGAVSYAVSVIINRIDKNNI